MLLGNKKYRKLLGLLSMLIVASGTISAQKKDMTGKTEMGRNSDSVTMLNSNTDVCLDADHREVVTVAQQPQPTDHVLFALKTNALFDAVLGFNGEIEVPIGRSNRWSIMAEFWKPWFVWKNNSRAFQLQVIGGEARYWFGGNRQKKKALTGWFGGLYYANGKYDFEWNSKGDQGEFNSIGATIGHTWSIHRRWNLEFSASIGHLWGPRRHYEATDDGSYLMWRYTTNSTYTGPTKLKVSFVWLIGRSDKKTGKEGQHDE